MKNSDFIQMTQCNIHSIKFPVDNVKEVLEEATFEPVGSYTTVELVKNPMTNTKVLELDNGLFFTLRTTFKKVTKELLSAKIYELKKTGLPRNEKGLQFEPSTDKEWRQVAEAHLLQVVPFSSELVNVFYCPEKGLLFTNNRSKHSRLALNHLIKLFELAGFKSIAVSEEKLGLNTKLTKFLEKGEPLFKYLHFQHEATLRKLANDNEEFLTCRHLDTLDGKEKALGALQNGFRVQSMAMRYESEDAFIVNFKLDEHLKIRSMRFVEYADVARQLNGTREAHKHAILTEYLEGQLNALLKIASATVLEFTGETKLESFV
ncbi:hypothetical protein ACI3P4_11605 [Glaesserella parasuis]|uniref:hypothetical protein n=1 Tax=Glaesserella parasuis TaxID=738 RepID=UPI0038533BB8